MADVTVSFSGSSSQDIEHAKSFWRAIDPPIKPKSALFVTGIDHRLKTAPEARNETNYAHLTVDQLTQSGVNPGLKRHQDDAERQRKLEETEYIQNMNDFRNDSKSLIHKRKQERIKAEEISCKVIQRTQEPLIELTDSSDDEDGRQAMEDIEKFEARLRQREVIKPS